jgi:hypothetical protein
MELELDARKGESLEINVYKKGPLQPRIVEQTLSGQVTRRMIYIGGEWDDENDEMVGAILTICVR